MNKLKSLLLPCALFMVYGSTAQNYVIQETNIDPQKNLSQFIYAAKRCEAVLEKRSPVTSLAFSNNSTMTNNFINALSDKFVSNFPPSKIADYGPVIERTAVNDRDKIVKLTYALFAADQRSTDKYVQVVVFFDKASPSPKILDIQVKNKADMGMMNITEREIVNLKKKPEPEKKSTPAKKKSAGKK